jgi:hypothetical protein
MNEQGRLDAMTIELNDEALDQVTGGVIPVDIIPLWRHFHHIPVDPPVNPSGPIVHGPVPVDHPGGGVMQPL